MERISMRNVQKASVSEYFDFYLSSAAVRGVKDKILQMYKNHFVQNSGEDMQTYCLVVELIRQTFSATKKIKGSLFLLFLFL